MKEPAYLVRFDDVCPTMDWETWNKVEKVLVLILVLVNFSFIALVWKSSIKKKNNLKSFFYF